MYKEQALKYISDNCTKQGLFEKICTFYVKIPHELFWKDTEYIKTIFEHYPKLQVGNIYEVWVEYDSLLSNINLIYQNGCEVVENNYIDNNYSFKLTNNLINLLSNYFEEKNNHDEYQMGDTIEYKILEELDKIKKESKFE